MINVSPGVEAEVGAVLDQIERTERVKIIFAIESGSRAWGFPSPDSDYDVRFVYARCPEAYISVFEPRDVIERPISGTLDLSGWDLKKAIGLAHRSNPALLEWTSSPLVYRQLNPVADEFRALAGEGFMAHASVHHYLSMAMQHLNRSPNSAMVRLKRYLYSLRPLLCARWVVDHETQPPMIMRSLVEEYLPTGEIRMIIDELLAAKESAAEVFEVKRIPALDDFLVATHAELENRVPQPRHGLSGDQCNAALFRWISELA